MKREAFDQLVRSVRQAGRIRRGKAKPSRRSVRRFAVCVKNKGYEASLERNKIYVVLPDPEAAREGDVRVIDESGEDYLYPAGWFVADWVMSPKAHQILRDALRVPPRARADIAGTLLHSLDEKEDPDVEAAWAVETERRLKQVQSGKVKLIAWERVRRSLRAGLRRGRTKT